MKRWTVDVSTFPDALQTYGGAMICTPEGEIVGWNGHRNVAAGQSFLIYLHPPDTRLRVIECSGPGPEGYTFPSVALDEKQMTLYVFGGWTQRSGPSGDLYRIKLGTPSMTWEKIEPPLPRPSARNGTGIIFDEPRNRLVIFGGDAGPGTSFTPLGDCWQFDIETSRWNLLKERGTVPPARWHASMTVDSTAHKAYLIGGAGRKVQFDPALYELDLTTDTWRRLPASGSAPPSLQGASMTFDEKNRVVVLAGGLRHTGLGPATFSQVWIFDPATDQWDETDCGHAVRRRDHLAAYDPVTGEHFLIGGRISMSVGNFYDRGVLAASDVRLVVRPVSSRPVTQP